MRNELNRRDFAPFCGNHAGSGRGHSPATFKGSACINKSVWSGIALAASLALAGPASAQIKVGVAGPLTGPNAAFGAQLKNGAEQAVADINAAGGINGQKIELLVGDDVSDPKQGVSVANKFV